VLLALVSLVGVSPAASQSTDETLLEQALASYRSGLDTVERTARLEFFRQAQRLFSRVSEGEADNPELLTNLGNAALQAEDLGVAVLAYRRALVLDPSFPRAVQNLEHARTLLPEWVPKPEAGGLLDSFFFWHRTLSRAERSRGAAFAFLAMGLLVAGAIRLRQPAMRNAAVIPALIWLVLIASVAVDFNAGSLEDAVVTVDETVARAADSALAPSTLPAPLPAGVEVRILEKRGRWLRVHLANGRDAWVAESSLTPVR
jgi:tetratricopeptide (TPR) repeat protein